MDKIINKIFVYPENDKFFIMNQKNVQKALNYATKKHFGQKRKYPSTKDYINHPIEVANLVLRYCYNFENIEDLIIVAYLHDTIEDTDATYKEIENIFGLKVAKLVSELTNDKKKKKELGKTKYLSIKMKNMSDDALTIKLCDRLSNISDLMYADEEFRTKYINETLFLINSIVTERQLLKIHFNIINTILIVLEQIIFYSYEDYSKESYGILKLIDVTKKVLHTS